MTYSYLALGDSYTIGEQVRIAESFPYQTVQLLRGKGLEFYAPEIIAVTGWTTDELSTAIDATVTLVQYDFVSLLIGVNNQYRGRSVSEYKVEFDHLLQRAINFAGNKLSNVVVLSIPDWGLTPFAEGRDKKQIATAIDEYNATAKAICDQHQIVFIDITAAQRVDAAGEGFVAADGLHPSGKEYAKWAKLLSEEIIKQLR
jgi:lysophospholipase L1-like esterase